MSSIQPTFDVGPDKLRQFNQSLIRKGANRFVMHQHVWLILMATLLSVSASRLAAETVAISYLERPPYYYTAAGFPQGTLIDLTKKIFEEAGIDYTMFNLPPKRILWEIQELGLPHCSPGWFVNPDRLKYAKFTLAFYQNRPLVMLYHRRNEAKFSRFGTISDLLRERSLIMGKVATFHFGSYIDKLITRHQPLQFVVKTSQEQLVHLITLNRVSYIFISPEETDSLIEQAFLDRSDFMIRSIPDITEGNKRYLMCSMAVDDKIIGRLNDSIRKLIDGSIWNG